MFYASEMMIYRENYSMKLDYPIRLQTYLAKSGFGGRRTCERLITDGRVKVNGKTADILGTKVNEDDVVQVDGQTAEVADRYYYFALNKPSGYVCTNSDPNPRVPLARDLIDIRDSNLLFSVGRLDKESTGLILFTNDGEIGNMIMHPSGCIEKEYVVETDRTIEKEDLEAMRHGIVMEDGDTYRILHSRPITRKKAALVLGEGKNREIRKLFAACGYEVKSLCRIRIGNLKLGELPVGAFTELSGEEVRHLVVESAKKGRGKRYDNRH